MQLSPWAVHLIISLAIFAKILFIFIMILRHERLDKIPGLEFLRLKSRFWLVSSFLAFFSYLHKTVIVTDVHDLAGMFIEFAWGFGVVYFALTAYRYKKQGK